MSEYRKKLIEVALPLEAINAASSEEKSIRHGHPSTLRLWWARRPLAACRAVLFGQFVDDPSSWPDLFPTEPEQDRERQRLFRIIDELVKWDNTNAEVVVNAARLEIARSVARNRKVDGEGNELDDVVLAKGVEPAVVNKYLAEVAPPVHDPFAGGGSIPLEAQRPGLRAIATDLNPVAVLINKALIEIPPKFAGMPPVNPESRRKAGMRTWKGAEGLAEDVRYYGKWMRDEAFERIGHLYPPVKLTEEMARGRPDLEPYVGKELTVIAWLWARTVASPDPAFSDVHVPLTTTFWLSKRQGYEAWLMPRLNKVARSYDFSVRFGQPDDDPFVSAGTKAGRGGSFRCILSNSPIAPQYARDEGKKGRLGTTLLAVVAQSGTNRVFLGALPAIRDTVMAASPSWAPEHEFAKNSRHMTPWVYGIDSFNKLFTSRQLCTLSTFGDVLLAAREEVRGHASEAPGDVNRAKDYADAVTLYLSFCVDKLSLTNSTLATWQTLPPRLSQAFGRQALEITWDFAEANPWSSAGGGFVLTYDSLTRVVERLDGRGPPGTATLADACMSLPSSVPGSCVVCTDPPYYDNVPYADLSDYFYVWLRRSLKTVFPHLFPTVLVPKQNELVADAFRHETAEAADRFFLARMQEAFRGLASASVSSVPLATFYAFRQSEKREGAAFSTGWATFLQGLVDAGLTVAGTLPMRTELLGALKKEKNVLASSILLSCRQRPQAAPTVTRSDFRRLLRQELPKAVKALQKGNIAPVDLAQASIGPGMAIFSRHAKVIEADGSAMSVRTALQLINEALDAYLAEQTGEFGPETRFAVTWFETRGFETGPYGEAETPAKARNVSVQGVVESGILHSAAGKVRLLKRSELPDDWEPEKDVRVTVWECTQHLIKRLEDKGEMVAADLLSRLNSRADPARDLAYRLYQTCERKGWAEEARAYNGLVVAWPELAKLAVQAKGDKPAQQEMFS